jgi:hypothetical protein
LLCNTSEESGNEYGQTGKQIEKQKKQTDRPTCGIKNQKGTLSGWLCGTSKESGGGHGQTDRQTDKPAGRQIQNQTARQDDGQTDRPIERQTDRQTDAAVARRVPWLWLALRCLQSVRSGLWTERQKDRQTDAPVASRFLILDSRRIF